MIYANGLRNSAFKFFVGWRIEQNNESKWIETDYGLNEWAKKWNVARKTSSGLINSK